MFNGILERNGLNYQPITDRMTQCAAELNLINSFICKTIVVYMSTCALSYMFCMFVRCGSVRYMPEIHKTNKLCSKWVEWYKMTVSGFTSELFYTWKILMVLCKWKAFNICCALRILRLIISFVLVSRQNFRCQTKKYSSNGCTVDFNIYIGKDAARGISKFGLGHDVKVRLISPYFNQWSLNMFNTSQIFYFPTNFFGDVAHIKRNLFS